MSKYSRSHLQRMAKCALADKAMGGKDFMFLVMSISMRTGLSEQEVERRIKQLAETGVCDQ